MYNRYTPRDDGSFSRNRMTEPTSTTDPPEQPIPSRKQDTQTHDSAAPFLTGNPGIFDFFRNLLPRKLETEDLIVLLLLLLMAGERQEDQSDALLTMALYFLL